MYTADHRGDLVADPPHLYGRGRCGGGRPSHLMQIRSTRQALCPSQFLPLSGRVPHHADKGTRACHRAGSSAARREAQLNKTFPERTSVNQTSVSDGSSQCAAGPGRARPATLLFLALLHHGSSSSCAPSPAGCQRASRRMSPGGRGWVGRASRVSRQRALHKRTAAPRFTGPRCTGPRSPPRPSTSGPVCFDMLIGVPPRRPQGQCLQPALQFEASAQPSPASCRTRVTRGTSPGVS